MATLAALSTRLRSEIGDVTRTFAEVLTGDGVTKQFQLSSAPVAASTLVVKVGSADVSSTTSVEEVTGIIVLAAAPANRATITVTGTTYRYFTDDEICYYINTAFAEHARTTVDSNGSPVTMSSLPVIDEYPLVILASTLALYTLATDSAFDIDIISPDGVSIPRSERFRQLSEVIQTRKEQYRELCTLLNLGMHRIEVFSLRRISRVTNRYVPIYRPQELGDGSLPAQISLELPTYGDITPASPVITKDLSLYAGDDFSETVRFTIDLTNYTPLAQVRLYPSTPGSRVGPVIIATFTITKSASQVGGIVDTLTLSLPHTATADFPHIAYYDLQLTAPDSTVKTYLSGKVFTEPQISEPLGPQ